MSESERQNGAISRREANNRKADEPVLGLLGDYGRRQEFHQTGDATRSEIAEEFFARARKAAEDYVEMEECSRPAWWNDFTRDAESRHWMEKHHDERVAWSRAIDLLWKFSDGESVDADALREALLRQSQRAHNRGRHGRNESSALCKARNTVREKAGLDRMAEQRFDAVRGDY